MDRFLLFFAMGLVLALVDYGRRREKGTAATGVIGIGKFLLGHALIVAVGLWLTLALIHLVIGAFGGT